MSQGAFYNFPNNSSSFSLIDTFATTRHFPHGIVTGRKSRRAHGSTMARMIFFLLSIPAAVGGSFVTATPSVNNSVAATNVSLLTDELPTCVNGSQFADWGEGFMPISCDNAVRAVRAAVENERRLFLDWEFYSRLYPPRRMPAHGWPLPQGATNG